MQGARLSETCTVTEGESPVQIIWYKDGYEINNNFSPHHSSSPIGGTGFDGTRQQQSSEGIVVREINQFTSLLSISSLKAEHSGEYSCEAKNAAGLARSKAVLRVYGEQEP
jgi:hypothetical protein